MDFSVTMKTVRSEKVEMMDRLGGCVMDLDSFWLMWTVWPGLWFNTYFYLTQCFIFGILEGTLLV